MTLLLQLNGELPETFPGHERRLWLWGCRRKACRRKSGSLRALRGVRATIEATSDTGGAARLDETGGQTPVADGIRSQQQKDLGAALFGGKPASGLESGNPFATGGNPFSASSKQAPNSDAFSNPAARTKTASQPAPFYSTASTTKDLPQTFAEKARVDSSSTPAGPVRRQKAIPNIPWPPPSTFQPSYPIYNLDAEPEYVSPEPQQKHSAAHDATTTNLLHSFNQGELVISPRPESSEEDLPDDAYDKAFARFASVLAQNPEQVLRYQFDGIPLLYSTTDAVGRLLAPTMRHQSPQTKVQTVARVAGEEVVSRIPRCGCCGADRVFELQLTPHAIVELEAEDPDGGVEGMEWGTIILGVCSRDCLGDAAWNGGETRYAEEWVGVQWEEVVTREVSSKKP